VKSVIKTLHEYSCITDGKKETMNDFQCNRMLKYNIIESEDYSGCGKESNSITNEIVKCVVLPLLSLK
jgi:hypothetical protein